MLYINPISVNLTYEGVDRMFMEKRKKVVALALAGVMSFGFAGMAMTSVTEAADKPAYTDGTHNKYSHELKEEDRIHDQNVRALKYKKRKGEISEKEYDKAIKKEQKRHDKKVSSVKADYEKHKYRNK